MPGDYFVPVGLGSIHGGRYFKGEGAVFECLLFGRGVRNNHVACKINFPSIHRRGVCRTALCCFVNGEPRFIVFSGTPHKQGVWATVVVGCTSGGGEFRRCGDGVSAFGHGAERTSGRGEGGGAGDVVTCAVAGDERCPIESCVIASVRGVESVCSGVVGVVLSVKGASVGESVGVGCRVVFSRTGDVVVGTDGCGASAVGVGEYPDVGRVFLSRLDVLKAFHLENLRSLGVFVHGECVEVAAGLLFFNVAEGADGQDHAVIVGKVAVLKCFFLASGGMRPRRRDESGSKAVVTLKGSAGEQAVDVSAGVGSAQIGAFTDVGEVVGGASVAE